MGALQFDEITLCDKDKFIGISQKETNSTYKEKAYLVRDNCSVIRPLRNGKSSYPFGWPSSETPRVIEMLSQKRFTPFTTNIPSGIHQIIVFQIIQQGVSTPNT